MARIVKEEDYAVKVNEILDAAAHLLYTKGYDRMTIADILDALQISKGAFYHYFESKAAVLEGFIERMNQHAAAALLPIIHDPELMAVEKLEHFFGTLDRMRMAHQTTVLELLRVWFADDNAIVRQKVNDSVIEQRAPMLVEIVRQGIAEGVFNTPHPDQSGELLLSLIQGMGNSHMKLMLSLDEGADPDQVAQGVLAAHEATMEAIERVLGAPSHALQRITIDQVRVWVDIMRSST
jgi:AcrR family transcriptional regulator